MSEFEKLLDQHGNDPRVVASLNENDLRAAQRQASRPVNFYAHGSAAPEPMLGQDHANGWCLTEGMPGYTAPKPTTTNKI